jgi:hypothetical protein
LVTEAGSSPDPVPVADPGELGRVVAEDVDALGEVRGLVVVELVAVLVLVVGVGPKVGPVGPSVPMDVVGLAVEVSVGCAEAAEEVPRIPTPASGRTTSAAARRRARRRGSVTVGVSRSGSEQLSIDSNRCRAGRQPL